MLVVYLMAVWVGLVAFIAWEDSFDRWFVIVFVGFFGGGLVIGGLTLGLSFLTYSDRDSEWRVDETAQVRVMNDSASVAGEFCLGSGTVEGTIVYGYYTDEGPGRYQFHAVDARRAEVREVEGIDPYVETLGRHFKVFGADHLLWQCTRADRYIFYIPPDTLRQNMTLDSR